MDVTCEVCGYDGSLSWLIKCKNSHICGQGRHLYCLDGLDVPSSPPQSIKKYGELECSLCAQSGRHGKSAGKAATAAAAAPRPAADEPPRTQKRQKILSAAANNSNVQQEMYAVAASKPPTDIRPSAGSMPAAGGPSSLLCLGGLRAPGGVKPQQQLPHEYSVFAQLDTQQQYCFDDSGGGEAAAALEGAKSSAARARLSGQQLLSGKRDKSQGSAEIGLDCPPASLQNDKVIMSSGSSPKLIAVAYRDTSRSAVSVANTGSDDDDDDIPLICARKADVRASQCLTAAPLQPTQPHGVARLKQSVAAASGKPTATLSLTQQFQGQLKAQGRPAKLIDAANVNVTFPFVQNWKRSSQQQSFEDGPEGPIRMGTTASSNILQTQISVTSNDGGQGPPQPPSGGGGNNINQHSAGTSSTPTGILSCPRSTAVPANSVHTASVARLHVTGTTAVNRPAGGLPGVGAVASRVPHRVAPVIRSGGPVFSFNIRQVVPGAGSSHTKQHTSSKGQGSNQDSHITAVGSAPSVRSQLFSPEDAQKDNRTELWSGVLPCHELQAAKAASNRGVKVILSATNPHSSMVNLCQELSQLSGDDMKWSLANHHDVPSTILDAQRFYGDNMACETCVVMYNRYQFGGAKEQFQQLLSTLKESGGLLALDVPITLKEKLQRIPQLENLLASPVMGSIYQCNRLFFSPHQVPVDYLDQEKGYQDCLLCLSGSRYHIHMVASWDKGHTTVKGILQKAAKKVSCRVQFFNVGDDSDGANKHTSTIKTQELKDDKGHKRKESQMELGKDIRAVLAAKQDQDEELGDLGDCPDAHASTHVLTAEQQQVHTDIDAGLSAKACQTGSGMQSFTDRNREATFTTSQPMTVDDQDLSGMSLQNNPHTSGIKVRDAWVQSAVLDNTTSADLLLEEPVPSSTLLMTDQPANLLGKYHGGQIGGDSDNSADTSYGQVSITPEQDPKGVDIHVPDFSWLVRNSITDAVEQAPCSDPISQEPAATSCQILKQDPKDTMAQVPDFSWVVGGYTGAQHVSCMDIPQQPVTTELTSGAGLASGCTIANHAEQSGPTLIKPFSQHHIQSIYLSSEQLLEDIYNPNCHQDVDQSWRSIPGHSTANQTLGSFEHCSLSSPACQGAIHWGQMKLPVLQLASSVVGGMISQLGLALLSQLPHLWSDLQEIPRIPLGDLRIQLLATDSEVVELTRIFQEAQEVLGFSFSIGSPKKAPQDLSNIHVLALGEGVVEKASDLKGLIIKSIAVHPIQLYRASALARALLVLAREVGKQRRVVTLADALQLARQCGAASKADCKPLYPARVMVLMNAQGFLETPVHNLKELAKCLQHGSRAWGERWSLLMRASDITLVQHQGSAELKALLAELLTARGGEDNSGVSTQQVQILQVLDASVQSRRTDMILLRDALKFMHERKPARLVIAAYSDKSKDTASGAKLTSEHHRCKDILAGSVTETLHFLRQLLKMLN